MLYFIYMQPPRPILTHILYKENSTFLKNIVVLSPAIFCPFHTSMCNRFYAFVFGTKYRISTCIFLHTIQILLWVCRYIFCSWWEMWQLVAMHVLSLLKKTVNSLQPLGKCALRNLPIFWELVTVRRTSMLKSKDRFYTLH